MSGRRRAPLLAVSLVVAAALSLASSRASARSEVDLPWTLRDVFPIAVRFVRVDRNCKVTDRDEASGYITFECADAGSKQPKRGALELIALDRHRSGGVRVQVTLADEPRYVELRFLELLERKIRDERGAAIPARPAPAPSGPDAGQT